MLEMIFKGPDGLVVIHPKDGETGRKIKERLEELLGVMWKHYKYVSGPLPDVFVPLHCSVWENYRFQFFNYNAHIEAYRKWQSLLQHKKEYEEREAVLKQEAFDAEGPP